MRQPMLRAHVWLLATLLPLLVRFVPLPRLMVLLTPRRVPYVGISPQHVTDLVNRRLANPRNMRRRACLRHGLTLFHFLRLSGYNAILNFSIYPLAQTEVRMQGHCWVSLAGKCISTPPSPGGVLVLTYADKADAQRFASMQ